MAEKTIAQRYLLKRELGAGGMGKVYLGQDTYSQQEIAIKELHSNLTDEDLITRFKREGEALRDLNHPNIVKMLDAVEEDGVNAGIKVNKSAELKIPRCVNWVSSPWLHSER